MIIKFDVWLMALAQRAYLWFYDWTGIYAAVLTYSMTMVFVFMNGGLSLLGALVLGIWFVPESFRFMAQMSGNFTMFNMKAREWQHHPVRWVGTGLFIGWLTLDLVTLHVVQLFSDVLMIVVHYLLTVQIRKREPREFEFHNKLAPQGAGS